MSAVSESRAIDVNELEVFFRMASTPRCAEEVSAMNDAIATIWTLGSPATVPSGAWQCLKAAACENLETKVCYVGTGPSHKRTDSARRRTDRICREKQ